jgi:hypothetical protein
VAKLLQLNHEGSRLNTIEDRCVGFEELYAEARVNGLTSILVGRALNRVSHRIGLGVRQYDLLTIRHRKAVAQSKSKTHHLWTGESAESAEVKKAMKSVRTPCVRKQESEMQRCSRNQVNTHFLWTQAKMVSAEIQQ